MTPAAVADLVTQRQTWWGTPILVCECSEPASFTDRLAAVILDKEKEITGSGTATPVAGVDSGLTAHWLRYNVLNWETPECARFAGIVVAGAKEFIQTIADIDDPDYAISGISCWANVLRHGDSLAIHHHDPGFVSAHFTVWDGHSEPPPAGKESGHTVYYRPGFIERSHGDEAFGGPWDADWRISVAPKAGRLTFFPSYVRHEVKTHLGNGERISIALDVYVKKQEQLPFYFAPPRWYVPR